MYLFPTRQWLQEYGRLLDEHPALADIAAGWGRRFDGRVHLVITDLPLAETSLGDLPDSVLADVPPRIEASVADVTLADAPTRLDDTVRPSLPPTVQDLLAQIEELVADGTIHVRVQLDPGGADVTALADPNAHDADAVVHGPLRAWQRVVDGRPVASAILRGEISIDGPGLLHVQYATLLQLLGDVAADVETTHLFATPPQTVLDVCFDAAVRQPVTLERHLLRQASLVSRLVSFP
jgi:hypothetical protein